MKNKNYVELLLGGIFLVAGLTTTLTKIDLPMIILVDGLLLSIFYLVFSAWIFAEILPLSFKIVAGIIYSACVFAMTFGIFKFFGYLFIVSIGYVLSGFWLINCLTKISQHDYRQHFFRCLLIIILLTYFHAFNTYKLQLY